MAAHLCRQLRNQKRTALGFARGRSLENDSAIGSNHRLIFAFGADLLSASAEGLALGFCFVELSFRPGLGSVCAGLREHPEHQHAYEYRSRISQAHTAAGGSPRIQAVA